MSLKASAHFTLCSAFVEDGPAFPSLFLTGLICLLLFHEIVLVFSCTFTSCTFLPHFSFSDYSFSPFLVILLTLLIACEQASYFFSDGGREGAPIFVASAPRRFQRACLQATSLIIAFTLLLGTYFWRACYNH